MASAAATDPPWVTILTPVYTGWQYLEECAMSVFLQTTEREERRFRWEWLIGVNGHGPTGGQALEKAKKLERLAELHGGGRGTIRVMNLAEAKNKAEAMNALLFSSKGEWVAVLDCDDTWHRDKLMTQYLASRCLAAGASVIGTFATYFGDWNSSGPALPGGWVEPSVLRSLNPIVNSSAIVQREVARRHLWSNAFHGLDDYDLWIRIAQEGGRLYNIPFHLTHHRLHGGSAFNGKGGQDVEGLRAYYFGVGAGAGAQG
jgi:glycosyltransferase involved in cell wall biosynthesis